MTDRDEALIRAGADVKALDKDGRTPLDITECNGHIETADALRRAGSVG